MIYVINYYKIIKLKYFKSKYKINIYRELIKIKFIIWIKTNKIRRLLKYKKLTVRISKHGVVGFCITKTDILHYGGVFLLE